MFERFTESARKSVVWAQEEARSLNHPHIGTEHLLLGLLREGEGVAARALDAAGVTLEATRDAVRQRVGTGAEPPRGHMAFTPRAKSVLELSLREALKLDHDELGTEHILLGLVREGGGTAAQILMSTVDGGLERVREDVIEILAGALPSRIPARFETIRRLTEEAGGSAIRVVRQSVASDDEIVKRLEAIEARLSSIERLLRDRLQERGEEGVS